MSIKTSRTPLDPYILLSALFLVGLGVVIIYSGSGTYAESRGLSSTFFLFSHMKKVLLGVGALLAGLFIPLRFWEKAGRPLLYICLMLLFYLLVSSRIQGAHGAKRWLEVGGLGIQPTELTKWALILFLAKILVEKKEVITQFGKGLVSSLVMACVVFLLILFQPNYSSASIILGTSLIMVFVGGARLMHLLALGLIGLPILLVVMVSSTYRLKRVLAYFDPQEHGASSYQTLQSLISLGNGGFLGSGLGSSTQKLGYLPMPFTDTIFSILGEELGFLGTTLCLTGFVILILRSLNLSYKQKHPFLQLVAVGIASSLGITFLMHIGVCTAVFPTTGQPLPFVSYGGSALIVSLLMVGVLLNMSANLDNRPERSSDTGKHPVYSKAHVSQALLRQRKYPT